VQLDEIVFKKVHGEFYLTVSGADFLMGAPLEPYCPYTFLTTTVVSAIGDTAVPQYVFCSCIYNGKIGCI